MTQKSKRGFASMDQEKQRMIASKGGKAAHQKGAAHEFTSEEARIAGRKGGLAAHRKASAARQVTHGEEGNGDLTSEGFGNSEIVCPVPNVIASEEAEALRSAQAPAEQYVPGHPVGRDVQPSQQSFHPEGRNGHLVEDDR